LIYPFSVKVSPSLAVVQTKGREREFARIRPGQESMGSTVLSDH
jgi:hypothetical protein